MARRTAVELCDLLEWRVKNMRYLLLFMGSDMAEPEQEEIRNCMTIMTLEIEKILEQTDGEQREDLGDEGPLGPLPPDLSDALGPGPGGAV